MDTDKDIIIIGGGPGGLTAAQYGARGNLRTLIIEEMASGGQIVQIHEIENYPGFEKPISGADLAVMMENQAIKFGAEIVNATVKTIEKKEHIFHVKTDSGDFTSYAVIIATGAKRKSLQIPGEDKLLGLGVSYCATCDGPFFRNKKVLAIGGGDAACSESTYLSKIASKVILIHRKDRLRAQKALSKRILENPNVEVRFNTECIEIKGEKKVAGAILKGADGKTYEEDFDAVFIFVGTEPQTQSLPPNLKKDESGYIIVNSEMETNIKGLFAVGDVRATPFRQVVTACGDGAIASHAAELHIDELKGRTYK